MSVEKYGCAIRKNLFAQTSEDSTFSHTRENSKMFNITSKYFSFFNSKPPESRLAHITRDFPTYYSCSYYSSMERRNKELFNPLAKIISIHETRTKHQQSPKENFKKKIS